jgi:hypothetical protein
VIGAVVGLALAGTAAYATIPDSGGTIHACMLNKLGTIRVIDPSAGQKCSATLETPLDWNQKGVGARGPTGPAGSNGPPGGTGARGPTGPAGPQGTTGARGPTGQIGTTGSKGDRGPTGAAGAGGPRASGEIYGGDGTAPPQLYESKNIVSVSRVAKGEYCVSLDPSIDFSTTVVATSVDDDRSVAAHGGINSGTFFPNFSCTSFTGAHVAVFMRDSSGNLNDGGFDLVVF